VDLCRKDVYVVKTGDSAAQMKDAITKMVKLALKMVNKEEIGTPEEEGYIPGALGRTILLRTWFQACSGHAC